MQEALSQATLRAQEAAGLGWAAPGGAIEAETLCKQLPVFRRNQTRGNKPEQWARERL